MKIVCEMADRGYTGVVGLMEGGGGEVCTYRYASRRQFTGYINPLPGGGGGGGFL